MSDLTGQFAVLCDDDSIRSGTVSRVHASSQKGKLLEGPSNIVEREALKVIVPMRVVVPSELATAFKEPASFIGRFLDLFIGVHITAAAHGTLRNDTCRQRKRCEDEGGEMHRDGVSQAMVETMG